MTTVPSGLAALLCLALAASTARAEEKPRDSAAAVKVVSPLIDEETVAVVRADLARVDLDAAAKAAAELAPDAKEDIDRALAPARAWLGMFRLAGGREVYVVASLADVGFQREPLPLLAVPLRSKADSKAMALLFPPPLETRLRPDGILLAAHPATLKRLELLKPDERPELAAAFEAAGDSAVEALLLPPKYSRRVIEEMMPQMPEPVGGGPSSALTKGLKWAAAGIDLPPAPALRLVIQSEDADAAAALREVLVKSLALVGRIDEVRALVPEPEKVIPLLTPKAAGDRLVLSLDARTPEADAVPRLAATALAQARNEARRAQAMNNLKQIGLAMHVYLDQHKRFPAPATCDAQGKPLLSWRVHLLPVLGHEELYKKFHLDESWDGPHNRKLVTEMPAVYRTPDALPAKPGHTRYVLPVGPGAAFAGKEGPAIADFKDGTSVTILAVELAPDQAVPWTSPQDLAFDPAKPTAGLVGPQAKGFLALFGDGHVQWIELARPADQLRALFSPAGGEPVAP